MRVSQELSTRQHKFHYSADRLALVSIEIAVNQKAHDVRGLELEGYSDIADYFVIASGNSDRHVRGIVDKISLALRDLGEVPVSMSGYENAEWVILDYGNIVVHVFHEPVRQFYNFDKIWRQAPEISLPDELKLQARYLRTGMI